jgi:hypothetical protein
MAQKPPNPPRTVIILHFYINPRRAGSTGEDVDFLDARPGPVLKCDEKRESDRQKGDPMARKPTESEEEYFARLEFERRKKTEEEKQKNMAAAEKKRLKELHYMRCPKCGMDLIEVDYKTLKVDRCSACDGVWLDAGELESVVKLEKSVLSRFLGR